MASLFRNNYKVYLYKYNYRALQNKIQDLLNGNSVNTFLFESFVTNLYTLGIPSNEVINKIKSDYVKYVNEFKDYKPNISNKNKKITQNIGDSKTVEYKSIDDKPSNYVKQERATISLDDTILQEALAQNYALQKLQRDYENTQMAPSSSQINWMSTMESRQTYDNYITNALNASKKLLDELFKPVIADLEALQKGTLTESDYIYAIDLTDLTDVSVVEKIETERTKYSSTEFLKTATGELIDDSAKNAVDSIGIITTTLEGLSNVTSFNLRQNILLRYGITIEANDIIEIVDTNINTTLRNKETLSESKLRDRTQFIGFVTKVSLSQRFNETSLLSVTCEGISKMLSLNPTINNNAVAPQFKSVADFISGKDKTQATSDANVVNVFSTFFDGLNAYDLFVKLLSDVLGVTPVKEDKTAYSMRLISDPDKLKKLPYQYSKPLLILYHMAVTYSTIREMKSQNNGINSTHIILARLDNNVNQEKLQAYLLMIRSQFDLFWSNMTTPMNILQTLANNTFLEVFEDRTGILILRPPRYNTWIEGDVIEEPNFIEWTQSVDDSTLKSRSDYQWSIPALGLQSEFCGGYYQDIPAMLKYGFRADAPKSSPSVQSEIDAAVYSALDVTKSNSNTRTFELTVPLTQDYKLGNLYYFPEEGNNVSVISENKIRSKGFVGYLTTITTTIAPGNVDVHRLTFKYMRAAECFDVNIDDEGLAGKLTTILNFKRLPELAMYQSSVTESMLTKTQKENLESKSKRLVSNSRYYWASYNGPNKSTFDSAINHSGFTLSKSQYTKLYKTMAPTNIRVGDFKALNGIKSSDFIPSQQLINAIWCADILSRTGYSNDEYALNTERTTETIYTRRERTIANSSKVLEFLKKDKTINNIDEVNYINENLNSLASPYATVNTFIKEGNQNISTGAFLIADSLVPNIKTEFGSEVYTVLVTYMNRVKTAYSLYNGDDDFYIWYEQQNKVSEAIVNLRLDQINICIRDFELAENNIYKYQDFLKKYEQTKLYMDDLIKYYDLKHKSTLDKVLSIFSKLGELAKVSTYSGLINLSTIENIYNSVKNVFKKTEVGIPAYLVNKNSQLPAVHTLKNTGTYIAGVCPVDYNNYIKTTLRAKIKDALINENITLLNSSLLTLNGYKIGTIKKLIYDDSLSDELNLYFFPVIELNNEELEKAYIGMSDLNLRLSDNYILTEQEINEFIQNKKVEKSNTKKKVACIVRITPTQIPETKIPTIQQIYNKDGLYVGYDINDGIYEVNPRKAIFDPGVLYEWSKSELEQLYTVNIYNFIECCNGNIFGSYLYCNEKIGDLKQSLNIVLNKKIPWDNMLQNNNLFRVPCVSNTKLSIKELDIPFNEEASTIIRDYFISLSLREAYEISYENSITGFMNIKDLITVDNAIQLALTFDIHNNSLASEQEYLINDELSSSKTVEQDVSIKSDFIKSTEDKEYTQVGLYNWGPYMPYNTKDLYPNYVNIGRTLLMNGTIFMTLKREIRKGELTRGKLYINGKYFCDTLEDIYRGDDLIDKKVQGETCIPNGHYRVTLRDFKNKGLYPKLIEVPYFEGIYIHTGSSDKDTDGCILVGNYKDGIWTANSNYVSRLKDIVNTHTVCFINIQDAKVVFNV